MKKKILFLITFLIKGDEAFKTPIISDKKCEDFNQVGNNVFGKTFYAIRPQDSNTARRIMRFVPNILYDDIYLYSFSSGKFLNLCVEYQKTFNSFSPKLAEWFLFQGKNCLTIGDSSKKHVYDINSTQIGMVFPEGKSGKFCLAPKIENLIVDIGLGFDLRRFICNSWTKFNFVIAREKTCIDLTTCSGQGESGFFPFCFMSTDCKKTIIPYQSIACALLGNKVQNSTFPPLNFGKFTNTPQVKTGLAAIHFDLGYDVLKRRFGGGGHLGVSLHAVFPTGNRPDAKFVLEPIIGPNKCWQVGVGINSSYDIYSDCNSKIGFYTDMILTHLFPSKQTRLFNLKQNGPLSQYLLLKVFDTMGDAVGVDRVANILAGETKIGADVMFDGSFMFQFNRCNFFANLGYNIWYRSTEKRSKTVAFRNFTEDTFGIKGNLPLCKKVKVTCDCPLKDISIENCVHINETLCEPVNTTASKSTISLSSEADPETVYLKISDINFSAPLHPSALSNKIFGSIGWNYDIYGSPFYWLIGAEAEFGQGNKALSQWGVLAKAGISF